MIYIEKILPNMSTITVNVYGSGGTGSHLIDKLGAIAYAFRQTQKREIDLIAYDFDNVSERNVARSDFSLGDINYEKTGITISRANLRYGLNWDCRNPHKERYRRAHFHFICVDNMKARMDYIKSIRNDFKNGAAINNEERSFYIFDVGNDKDFGQIVLLDTAGELADIDRKGISSETVGTPSCAALDNPFLLQGLFVNQFMALITAEMFWQFISNYVLDYNQVFINLGMMKIITQLKENERKRPDHDGKSKTARRPSQNNA